MDVSAAPGGVAEPQGQIVQGGDQLPSDKVVGHTEAVARATTAIGCY